MTTCMRSVSSKGFGVLPAVMLVSSRNVGGAIFLFLLSFQIKPYTHNSISYTVTILIKVPEFYLIKSSYLLVTI